MNAQLTVPQCCKEAYALMVQQKSMPLLAALREACDYNIELYKETIMYLARRLDLASDTDGDRWPVYALDLAEWETCPSRLMSDIRDLLCV
jgi:hypothetical protein